ncbi:MAG: ethanolamine utilization protein EutJ [Microbacterium sp.]|uniref:ethanolamine utilization protein EutJ n=1 Tax=Microbacterium sp. TaxID=51671 RepID=UPI001AD52E67|nr:ethanolamine utilization protein EutJ [Microbacterium sp.]MBN9176559.1 ethanolamine utilization protein EutJ [Microbacterium sp.]
MIGAVVADRPASTQSDEGDASARADALLNRAAAAFRHAIAGAQPAAVGIDLGTATCVIVVVDADGGPAWVDARPTAAVRDGVVVDFFGARDATASLKADAEAALGIEITRAGVAYPPGVPTSEAAACRFVLESAGIDEVVLLDEVSAAQAALGLTDGVLVDVGGGSTGVGIFRGGELVRVDDRPGGGTHLDLILAGGLGVDVAEAERRKRTDSASYRGILKPGIQRIAASIAAMSPDAGDLPVHLAGGAVMVDGAREIIAGELGREVHTYPHSLFITPVGIARTLL